MDFPGYFPRKVLVGIDYKAERNNSLRATFLQDPGVPTGLQQQVSSTSPVSLSLQMWLQWAAPTNTNGSSGESYVGPAESRILLQTNTKKTRFYNPYHLDGNFHIM